MTSTNFTAGLKDDEKISLKVLKPPGGGSNLVIGIDEKPTDKKPEKNLQKTSKATVEEENARNAAQSSAKKSMTRNPITWEESEVAQPQKTVVDERHVVRNPITGAVMEFSRYKIGKAIDHENIIQAKEKDSKTEDEKNSKCKTDDEKKSDPKPGYTSSIRVKNPPGGKSSGIF